MRLKKLLVINTIEIGSNLEANLTFNHQQKDTNSVDGQYPSSTNKEYTTNTFDSNLKYKDGPLKVITGIQTWYAERLDKYGTAEKDNKGVFIQSEYSTGNTVFSFFHAMTSSTLFRNVRWVSLWNRWCENWVKTVKTKQISASENWMKQIPSFYILLAS